nr:hypothetical protein Itr_chr05CG05690 [Ipomoea trifida]
MLVTKKSKPGDTVKNTRQTKKDSNVPTTSRGNQYSLLADIPDDSAPTTHRQHTDKKSGSSSGKNGSRFQSLAGMVEQNENPRTSNSKGKQPAEPRSGNTRKFPPSSNPTRSSIPHAPATVATTVPLFAPIHPKMGKGGVATSRLGEGKVEVPVEGASRRLGNLPPREFGVTL